MTLYKFNKDELDNIFADIAKELKKKLKGKNFSYELIVVGGASILLNYSFRMSTIDIDCLDVNDALMNDAVYKFKRYEDASLEYSGINKHEGEGVGLFDTVLSHEDYEMM